MMRKHVSWSLCLAVCVAAFFAPLAVRAQPAPVPAILSLPAGGSAQVTVRAFCLDYGDPFPGPVLQPGSLAPAELRLAVSYSLEKGYAGSQAWQVQLAIWHLTDGQWHAADHSLADEIVAYARSGATPPDAGLEGTSLPDAIAAGAATAAVAAFHSISSPAYHGEGTLTVTNAGAETLVVHIPYGIVFNAEEPLNAQRMLVYAVAEPPAPPTDTPGPGPATDTPTPTPEPPTNTPTVTPEPPTSTPTGIVAPGTDTPTPTGTVLLPPSGGARPVPGGSATIGLVAAGALLVLGGWLLARRQG